MTQENKIGEIGIDPDILELMTSRPITLPGTSISLFSARSQELENRISELRSRGIEPSITGHTLSWKEPSHPEKDTTLPSSP